MFLDFGYACAGGIIDIKANDGLPPIDLCPKEGRDIFQILVDLLSSDTGVLSFIYIEKLI